RPARKHARRLRRPAPGRLLHHHGVLGMSDITGSKDFVAFGSQEQRPEDAQPERVIMRAPDGRTVQVMAEDVEAFAERGFVPEGGPTPEPEPAKPRRSKATGDEEAS
ncbi:MAG: hypothetical protein ACM3W4_07060, partial [Ignavibacteriales bacterium]